MSQSVSPYFGVSIPALTKRKGSNRNNLGKREFLPAVPPDDQYVLVRAESDWHWDKQSIYWHLSRKSNRMSSACAKQKFQHSTTSIDTQKKCSPATETWQIAGLDITLATPRKVSFDCRLHTCGDVIVAVDVVDAEAHKYPASDALFQRM